MNIKNIFICIMLAGVAYSVLADKKSKPAQAPASGTKTGTADAAYRFGFVAKHEPVAKKDSLGFGTRVYDNRLGRYQHTDPVNKNPYRFQKKDSL